MPYMPPRYDGSGNPTGLWSDQNPVSQPSNTNSGLMTFEEYYKQATGNNNNPYGLMGRLDDFFTGRVSSAKQAYENYLADYEFRQNQAVTAAANQEKYAREDSEIRRRMKDYEAAGLNPYLLLTSGSAGAATSSATEYAKYKRSSSKEKESKDASKMIGTAIRAIALIAMLAG